MTSRIVQGKNVTVRCRLNGEMIAFACATGVEFYYDTELVEKATVGTAGYKHWTYGLSEWGMTISALSVIAPTTTMMTVFDTMLEQLRKNGMETEIAFEDNVGNLKAISGTCMIPHTGMSVTEDGFSSDTVELKGSGAFSIATTLLTSTPGTPPDVKTINFTSALGGEGNVTFAETIGKEILYVSRDGIGQEVITVGTPTDKQVKFVTGSGNFSFNQPLKIDEWLFVMYL